MRNMFTEREKSDHIILLAMEKPIKELLNGKALTLQERVTLTKSLNSIKEFHKLVFQRFGEPYRKKIEKTMEVNRLGLYAKDGEEKKCITYCASEDVYKMGKFLRSLQCVDCEKCNHLDCGVYAMLCAVDSEINNEEEGCPYRI